MKLNVHEISIAARCLNEFLNGLPASVLRPKQPFPEEHFRSFLRKIKDDRYYFNIGYSLDIDDNQRVMTIFVVNIVLNEIEEWEIPIRLGFKKDRILNFLNKLEDRDITGLNNCIFR
ncbi:hypothetical protein QFZ27_002635 [Inquilinus ginsengisoli]|jgi:hypothetical protein|uniref:hypothetical protein n=1 Tax=Inquilinus ginsengisoli TaxID=363840 RepID=UPI003D1E97D3